MIEDPHNKPGSGARGRVLRAALIALCLMLAGSAGAYYARWKSDRQDLLETLRDAGLDERDAKAYQQAARERTPLHAELVAARALVIDVLNSRAAPLADGDERLTRLARARELALAALAEQPTSWQAQMLLGTSIYRERSLAQDRRLYTAYSDWEQPLRRAVEGTAGKLEPRRMLAAAYLECWQALVPEKRAYARELLREVFARDPIAFTQLAGSWLEVADDQAEAFTLVPERPDAWLDLERIYTRSRDWDSFCQVHVRRFAALETKLRATLEEASQRLRLGDLTNSRAMCLQVVTSAPPSRRFVPFVVRALELYPPGLHGTQSSDRLQGWLRYALRLDAVGVTPLPPRAINRLIDAIGELGKAEAAHAALIGNNTYRVQQSQKLARSTSTPAWVPFLIANSRSLMDRDPEAAAAALARVPSKLTVVYWLAQRDVALALGDRAALAAASEQLEKRYHRRQWSALDWTSYRGVESLLFLPATAAEGLRIELLPKSPTGAAVEVMWNGQIVAVQPIWRGKHIDLSLGLEPRLNLLEVRSLAGESITPGRVWLRGAGLEES